MRSVAFVVACLVACWLGAPRCAAAAAPLTEVVVSDRTAAALGLATGDTLEIGADAAMRRSRRFVVGGIYRPTADPFEVGFEQLHVVLHLPDLEWLTGPPDRVDRFAVRLQDPTQAQQVADEIAGLGLGIAAYTSTEVAARNSSTFVVISQFHKAIGFVSMLAGLVFLVAIMVLKVETMRRELGMLRLIGISRRTVTRSVLLIAALVSLLGSIVGIGLARIAVAIINPASQARYDTDLVFARLTPEIVLLAVGLSIPAGLLAGWLVARHIVHRNPLDSIGR
ncbi:MAG TPA: FtsX-like permease family protein [Candidatus Krumholzibacteria bacterium]|nr:FtsX-like permease family protein [Candidatus Krumholzibacteria bacterium]